jgi:hypothetical protein
MSEIALSDALARVDLAICWECADTRPVFAHNFCEQVDRELSVLRELLEVADV